jgi:hypothetical protein
VNVQPLVDPAQLCEREINALPPDGQVLRITLLQFHQLFAACRQDGLVGFRRGVHSLVAADQLCDGIAREGLLIENGLPPVENHAELGAPVPDVIVGDDLVPHKCGDACETVADDRAADVADVHRFGNVRRAEIDNNRLRIPDARDIEALVGADGVQFACQRVIADGEVQEARAVHADLLAQTGYVERCLDLLGQRARIGLEQFCQRHRRARLVVAVACIGGKSDGDVEPGGCIDLSSRDCGPET